jgi:hypothetical protein
MLLTQVVDATMTADKSDMDETAWRLYLPLK